jgi:hypothetical protein
VEDDAQERTVDLNSPVVLGETQFPELVHEKIDPRARRADHFCQGLLRNFGEYSLGPVVFTVTRKQQKSPSQTFLTGVKQLVDEVLLDSGVPGQHMRYEAVRKRMFCAEHAHHLDFFNEQYGSRYNRGGRRHAHSLTSQASLQSTKSKKSAAPITLPGLLADVLKAYKEEWKPNAQGFLFTTRNGRPPSGNKVVEYQLWPIFDALDIPRCGLHAFRHSVASLIVDAGYAPEVAQQKLSSVTRMHGPRSGIFISAAASPNKR